MAESSIQVNSGSGPKLHTWNRTITGPGSVEDEFFIPGEYPMATYTVVSGLVGVATANKHMLQIMAGGTLNVYIRRIWVSSGNTFPAAASMVAVDVFRVSTAGTGGGGVDIVAHDTTDAAAGAAGMIGPTVLGTETTKIFSAGVPLPVAPGMQGYVFWDKSWSGKSWRIPAGTTNGIVLKNTTAVAAVTMFWNVEIVELNY